jgi:hypothetical protein
MMDERRDEISVRSNGRRRFLGLLGGTGLFGLIFPHLHGRKSPDELSLKEADFYRSHDLAG